MNMVLKSYCFMGFFLYSFNMNKLSVYIYMNIIMMMYDGVDYNDIFKVCEAATVIQYHGAIQSRSTSLLCSC